MRGETVDVVPLDAAPRPFRRRTTGFTPFQVQVRTGALFAVDPVDMVVDHSGHDRFQGSSCVAARSYFGRPSECRRGCPVLRHACRVGLRVPVLRGELLEGRVDVEFIHVGIAPTHEFDPLVLIPAQG
jgi:hypothetical protein